MKLKKAWVIFLLVLVISVQLVVLTSFHDVETGGLVNGNSVIGIAKWEYVQGSVRISISPVIQQPNGTSIVQLVLPNGTSLSIPSSYSVGSPYSFTLQLPRTGDSLASGSTSGPIALSQSEPLNVTIAQNVGNVSSYLNYLKSESNNGMLPAIDVYTIIVYGQAQVGVSGYGIAL